MTLKTERRLAKLIAGALTFLTLMEVRANAQNLAKTFMRANRNLSRTQAVNYSDLARRAGKKYRVSANLIAAIIVVESHADTYAISKTGDYGLMQINYKTHKRLVTESRDLFVPEINIDLGTKIFAGYRRKTGSTFTALKRYNGGSKSYAHKVMRVYRQILKGGK